MIKIHDAHEKESGAKVSIVEMFDDEAKQVQVVFAQEAAGTKVFTPETCKLALKIIKSTDTDPRVINLLQKTVDKLETL
jgi:ribosome-associated translation inhibitor RaiA